MMRFRARIAPLILCAARARSEQRVPHTAHTSAAPAYIRLRARSVVHAQMQKASTMPMRNDGGIKAVRGNVWVFCSVVGATTSDAFRGQPPVHYVLREAVHIKQG